MLDTQTFPDVPGRGFPILRKAFDSIDDFGSDLFGILQDLDTFSKRMGKYDPTEIRNSLIKFREVLVEAENAHVKALQEYLQALEHSDASSGKARGIKDAVLQKAHDILQVRHVPDTMQVLSIDPRYRAPMIVAGFLELLEGERSERVKQLIDILSTVVKKIDTFVMSKYHALIASGVRSPVQAIGLEASIRIDQLLNDKDDVSNRSVKILDRIIESIH